MIRTKNVIGAVIGLNLFAGVMSSAYAEPAEDEVVARESWRETMARSPAAPEGCFHASYPSLDWEAVDCVDGPSRVFIPRKGAVDDLAETVGNGVDFAAVASSGLISQTVGTFPTVTGVTKETDSGKNVYSIQLNSNFMSGVAVCSGKSKCLAWEQFVYSSSEHSAFMQYWLIEYGTCPSGGWMSDGEGDCYMNSKAVSVPKIAISKLSTMKMSATAVKGGNDTLVFTADGEAYSTSGKDTVTDLATGWTQSEFNLVGDGGGSEATFNTGSSVTVKVAITDGSTSAPTCGAKDGTTGETNNLKLGTCKGTGGSSPYIQFTESN
jgi:hypothetical protein